MAQSRGPEIEQLRQYAQGRFLDATHDGWYKYDAAPMAPLVKQVRAVALDALALHAMAGTTKES